MTTQELPDTVTLCGVTYVRPAEDSPVKIVVLQRGWVMVGRWSQDGEMCALDNAYVVRAWGTTKGLPELIDGPTPSTKLDGPCRSTFLLSTMVQAIDANADRWPQCSPR